VTVTAQHQAASSPGIVSAAEAAGTDVLQQLGVTADAGLSSTEAARRLAWWGPNAVSSHRARLLPVLWHQLRSPRLGLLLTAAVAYYFTGERSDAVIIGVIVGLSVGLGFVNEYRAEKAAGTGPLNLDTLARMMRLHPAVQAAHEISQALDVLTSYTWPVP
jgi:Mg2+-importing ATPase